MMKKWFLFTIVFLIIALVISLSACSTSKNIEGTFVSEDGWSLDFSGTSFSEQSKKSGNIWRGTYEVDGDRLYLYYEYFYDVEYNKNYEYVKIRSYTFKKGIGCIYLDDEKYTKK